MRAIYVFRFLFLIAFAFQQGMTHAANPPADLSGEYRILVKNSKRYLYEDGNGNKKVSTLQQVDNDFTRFILQRQGDGSYRVTVKANGRYWHVDESNDKVLSTRWQPNDDYTRFFFEQQLDGTYRIKLKASSRYLYEENQGDQLISTRKALSSMDDNTHFYLVNTSIKSPVDLPFSNEIVLSTNPIAPKEQVAESTSATDGDYVCTIESVDAAQAFDINLISDNTSNSIIFPGAMIYASDYFTGRYQLITAKRSPQVISTDIPILQGEPKITVNEPNLSNVRTAVNEMMMQQKRGKENSQLTFEIEEVYNESQLSMALGGRFDSRSFSLGATLGMSAFGRKHLIVAKFMQEYYSIDVDQVHSPYDMFSDQAEAATIINNGRTPLYVSQVKYGRAAYFFLETTESLQDIKVTLDAAYNGVINSASGNFSSDFNKLVERNKMKVLAIGGNGSAIVKSISGINGFREYILEGGDLDPNALGRPIAYTMRFLSDLSVAHTNLTTKYIKRECRKTVGRYNFEIKYVTCTNVSADEQGDDGGNDQNEVWGMIYTRLKRGTTDIQSFDESFGSDKSQKYLEQNINDADVNKRAMVDIKRSYSVPIDQIDQYRFYIRGVLWDHDTWSKNDLFDAEAYIQVRDATDRSSFLELKNGSDTIRIYYTIKVEDN